MEREEFSIYKKRRISYFPEEKDLFNKLPEDLLINIISLLPTKETVGTSILSRRWRYLCNYLNNIYYKYTEPKYHIRSITDGSKVQFQNFLEDNANNSEVQFHKFLMNLPPRNIKSLEIEVQRQHYKTINRNLLNSWLTWAVERGVEKLVLKINEESSIIFYHLPTILFQCKTLMELKLSNLYVEESNNTPISWPLLKNLSLSKAILSVLDFNKMIGNCNSLERLSIVKCIFRKSNNQGVKFNLCSPSVKYLELWDCSYRDNSIKVDLPSLVDLSFNMLLYRFEMDQRDVFAAAAARVKSLTVGARCLKAFARKNINGSTRATHVEVDLRLEEKCYMGMVNLIAYCSNAQTLVINFEEMKRIYNSENFNNELNSFRDEKLRNKILHIKKIHVHGVDLDDIINLTISSSFRYENVVYQNTHIIMSLSM